MLVQHKGTRVNGVLIILGVTVTVGAAANVNYRLCVIIMIIIVIINDFLHTHTHTHTHTHINMHIYPEIQTAYSSRKIYDSSIAARFICCLFVYFFVCSFVFLLFYVSKCMFVFLFQIPIFNDQ